MTRLWLTVIVLATLATGCAGLAGSMGGDLMVGLLLPDRHATSDAQYFDLIPDHLLATALQRARAGDCAGVVTAADQVRRYYPERYNGLLAEPAIAKSCLPAYLAQRRASAAAAAALPDLDRAMIRDSIANVQSQAIACTDHGQLTGRVVVHVQVAADGHVLAATSETAPDPALGDCVSAAIQHATFPHTRAGGGFRYPFVF